ASPETPRGPRTSAGPTDPPGTASAAQCPPPWRRERKKTLTRAGAVYTVYIHARRAAGAGGWGRVTEQSGGRGQGGDDGSAAVRYRSGGSGARVLEAALQRGLVADEVLRKVLLGAEGRPQQRRV
ncbi:hypothetical protein EG872_16405, partial [Enterococcus faecalis]